MSAWIGTGIEVEVVIEIEIAPLVVEWRRSVSEAGVAQIQDPDARVGVIGGMAGG